MTLTNDGVNARKLPTGFKAAGKAELKQRFEEFNNKKIRTIKEVEESIKDEEVKTDGVEEFIEVEENKEDVNIDKDKVKDSKDSKDPKADKKIIKDSKGKDK